MPPLDIATTGDAFDPQGEIIKRQATLIDAYHEYLLMLAPHSYKDSRYAVVKEWNGKPLLEAREELLALTGKKPQEQETTA